MKSLYTYLIALVMLLAAEAGMSQGPRSHSMSSPSPGFQKGGSSPSPSYSSPKSNYSAPQPSHSQPAPSKPTYSQPAPSHSQPSYSQPTYSQPAPSKPTYSQPAPSYSQPTHSQPSYSQPTYSQPSYAQPSYSQPAPKPTYSQPAPSHSQPTHSQPSYSQPTYSQPSYAQPTYSQPAPKPTYSQPAHSQSGSGRPVTDSRPNVPTQSYWGNSNTEPSPVTGPQGDSRPVYSAHSNDFSGVSNPNPKPNSSGRPTTDSRPTVTYVTGFESPTGRPTTNGTLSNNGNPRTEPLDPRINTFTSGNLSGANTGRPTTSGPGTLSSGGPAGGDDEPVEPQGGVSPTNQYVTICIENQVMQVPSNQVQAYLSHGGVIGPCHGTTGGPIGNTTSVGNVGDPIDHTPTAGPIGQGGSVGPIHDPIDGHGGHVGHGGNGGNNGGNGNNGGPGPIWSGNGCNNPGPVVYNGGGYYSGYSYVGTNNCSNSWYVGTGCGHTSYGGFCGSCSNTNYFYHSNYYNNCTAYYGYGYYYPASYNTGWCYTGLYSGVSFTCIYPWVPRSYRLESFTPSSDNRRVVILDSKNGRRHWKIVEERVWVPERMIWDNGVQQKQDGYYTWKVVSKRKYRHRKHHCVICNP